MNMPARFCMSAILLGCFSSLVAAGEKVEVRLGEALPVDTEQTVVIAPDDPVPPSLVGLRKQYPDTAFKALLRPTFDSSKKANILQLYSFVLLDEKGRPHGTECFYAFWGQGRVRSVEWKHGVRDGVERLYHERDFGGGLRAEIPWKDGVIEGERKSYSREGEVVSVTPYVDGEPEGVSKSWSYDGKLTRECSMKAGKRHGVMKQYWPDTGEVKREVTYDMGTVVGVAKDYYSDGRLKREIPFEDNRMHGVEKQYDPDGTVSRVRYWYEGEVVDEETWQARSAAAKD